MRSKISPIGALVFAVFTGIAALFFMAELAAFERTHTNSLGHTAMPGKPVSSLLSLQATHDALRACDQQLSPPAGLTKTAAELDTVARECSYIAGRITASMPSHAYGIFVVALADQHIAGDQTVAKLIEKSALLAPAEGWLAQRRLAFSFRQGVPNNAIAPDIDILLTTQSGAAFLAGQFIRVASTRQTISKRLESASDNDQNRFINLLRRGQAML